MNIRGITRMSNREGLGHPPELNTEEDTALRRAIRPPLNVQAAIYTGGGIRRRVTRSMKKSRSR